MADKRPAGMAAGAAEIKTEDVSLLDQVVDAFTPAAEPRARAAAVDIVQEFANQVLAGSIVYARDTEAMVKARIAQLDALISAQLNEVMHAPEFQRLEAAWRGLRYFVDQTNTSTMLKIKVLNASKKDLARDLESASVFVRRARQVVAAGGTAIPRFVPGGISSMPTWRGFGTMPVRHAESLILSPRGCRR